MKDKMYEKKTKTYSSHLESLFTCSLHIDPYIIQLLSGDKDLIARTVAKIQPAIRGTYFIYI
jgi:hypothetical protein